MSRKEKACRRYWFWFTIFILYLAFGLYCICTNFVDIFGMLLLSPFIFASLPLYAYLYLGMFIWSFMSLAMDDFYKE
ncbi:MULTISPECIES: hypothetical protein [Streptococcus]|uniref:hypothetical protein n=1 Tax=Streptococcus TaxID=1301 RepID=UPI001562E52B|nr:MULTISPECIES: hypothetical protein [Streptococcus]